MTKKDINHIIDTARKAGETILNIYSDNNFDIELKEDKSPLTKADKEAHKIIEKNLKKTGLPILSEEGKNIPYEVRKTWENFWMVDPIDGTKEFIKRNGEFTVNIALVKNHKPTFGLVYAPMLDKLYYGGPSLGAFMIHKNKITAFSKPIKNSVTRIVASRSHLNQETQDFINQFKETKTVSMGSSLKFMLILEGKADIYPRFAPTMEWDTAASHAILLGIGIDVVEPKSQQALKYNKQDLVNPYFLAG